MLWRKAIVGGMEATASFDRKSEALRILRAIRSGESPASEKPLDLRDLSLAGEDLSDMDLSGINFAGSDLSGADLSNTKLFKANLTNASLINAKLRKSEMSGADLSGASLEGADATLLGLGMACLKNARLFGANLEKATLTKADLSGADLRCASLRHARIREADMSTADFTGTDLRDVDLGLSNVSGAIFKNADMRGARLRALTGFQTADWIGVDIRNISFAGAYHLRRFIVDQNYLKEFRESSRVSEILYYLWLITSDCGRSIPRWCAWIVVQVLFFAGLYVFVGVDYGRYPTMLSPIYFSVVTLTTLGYGDVIPSSSAGQIVAMLEVITGYVMLGGLLSILSNKMARRGD